MKHYPKLNEDICDISKWQWHENTTTAVNGSLDELIVKFKNFYRESHRSLFETTVKEVWLEHQLVFNGKRKMKRRSLGPWGNLSFGRFTKIAVGTTQKVLTASFCFTPVATYFIDFFPDFLLNDPFENPEKYEYPYKNITLDHLIFVYQMDERLELLAEADRRAMSYAEFLNWATNWFLCRNLDKNDNKYELIGGHLNWPYVRNNKLKMYWENKKFKFKTK